jgi:hypothetical protein
VFVHLRKKVQRLREGGKRGKEIRFLLRWSLRPYFTPFPLPFL